MDALSPGTDVTPSLRLVRKLGAGGMGSVWIAEHLTLRTQVVVKFMSETLASNPEALSRFSREAAAASLVKSPHVVHMIDHGVLASGVPFIAMELLEGHDLSHRLAAERTLPPRQVATIVSQVGKALARAHERGVVHRDIKPDNIFLSDGGGGEAFVKVLDFGIAKGGDAHQQMSQTKTGAALGTPYYMSPEQTMGAKAVDHRTDLWALGVVAFEALTGRRPFEGETIGALAVAICNAPIPRPSQANASLPAAFDGWFERACARDVAARFASAKEMADAFEAAAGGCEPVPFSRGEKHDFAHAPTETPSMAEAAKSRPTTMGAVSESAPGVQKGRARALRTGAIVAGAAIVVIGAATLVARNRAGHESQPASSASVATTPGPSAPPVVSVALPALEAPSAPPAASPSGVAVASAHPPAAAARPGGSAAAAGKPAPAASAAATPKKKASGSSILDTSD